MNISGYKDSEFYGGTSSLGASW